MRIGNKIFWGVVLSLLCMGLYGISPIFAKWYYETGGDAFSYLALRPILLCVACFALRPFQETKATITPNYLKRIAILSCFYLLIYIGFFKGIKYIPVSMIVVIFSLYPIMVVLLSPLLKKQPIKQFYIISALVCLVGVGLVVFPGFQDVTIDPSYLIGIGLALLAAIGMTGDIIVSEEIAQGDQVYLSFFGLTELLVASIFGGLMLFYGSHFGDMTYLWMGSVAHCVAVLSMVYALRFVGAEKFAILSISEPLFALLFSAILLAEILLPIQYIGSVLILATMSLVVLGGQPLQRIQSLLRSTKKPKAKC